MKRQVSLALATLVAIAAVAALSIAGLAPPASLPASAPATEFSAARALVHLWAIAHEPHATGTPAQAAVRDYLLAQLRILGLQPQVQETPVAGTPNGVTTRIENIVVRLAGSGSGEAILLVAHYDSVPAGPGAADNAAGVAVLLETLRALKASTPLRNDVLALLSDGEELGLLGASGFVAEHPWARRVRLVLNLDTFSSGPAMMWQTSPGNGWLIRQYARSVPRPVATSWSHDVSRLLPYDTDLLAFLRAGLPGYNFWTAVSYPESHTARDRTEIVSPATVQHAGAQALALVRRLGNLALVDMAAPDAVYFTVWGPLFVDYPATWAVPLAAIVGLIFLAVLALGLRKGQLSWGGLGLGSLAALAELVVAPLLATLAWRADRAQHPGASAPLPTTHTANDWLYAIGFVALTVALVSAIHALARRKVSLPNLALGVLAPWLVLLVASSLTLPGFSYMLAWPLLFSLLGLGWTLVGRPAWVAEGSWGHWAVASLATVPALVLWVPAIDLFYQGTALGFLPALVAAIVLLLGALTPQLDLLLAPNHHILPAVALAFGLGFLLAGGATAGLTILLSIAGDYSAQVQHWTPINAENADQPFVTPRCPRSSASCLTG